MSQVITRDFDGKFFIFREDGYFNMTQAAGQFGKRLDNFWQGTENNRYAVELAMALGLDEHPLNPRDASKVANAQRRIGFYRNRPSFLAGYVPGTDGAAARYLLTDTTKGNVAYGGGTWAHPRLAVYFARWLDPKFAVFCDAVIHDLIHKKADLVITKPEESASMALPSSYLDALKALVQAEEERQKLIDNNAALQATNQRLLPAAEVGQAVGQRSRIGVVDFCRKLPGVNTMQVQKDLMVLQYLFKREGHWAVYSKHKGTLFDEVLAPDGRSKIVVLEKGQQLLVSLYHDNRLTMKAGCKPLARIDLELAHPRLTKESYTGLEN